MSLLVFVRGLHKRSPSLIKPNSLFGKALGKYLLLTNTFTSGVLMAVGDLIDQEIEYRREMLPTRYDWYRLTRMLLVGFSFGPFRHYFYKYLDIYFPKRNLGSICKKIALDQVIMSPICIVVFFYGMGLLEGKTVKECTQENNSKFVEVYMRNLASIYKKIALGQVIMSPICIVVFFYGMGLLEGKAVKECTQENNSKFVEVYMLDWFIWPPTQFINFYFVPLKYQILYINVVTMIFNAFLSYIKHRDSAEATRLKHQKLADATRHKN